MTWANANYLYKKSITIDHTKVNADESDFPIMVSVTDTDLKVVGSGGHVQSSSGYDIIFYDSTESTQLKHQIEKYVSTTGKICFWVKIPSLSSTDDTIIYMYYDYAGIGGDLSTTDTWDSNYGMIYHMNETNTAVLNDSTSNNRDTTSRSAHAPTSTSGKCGDAINFSAGDWYKFTYPNVFNGSNNYSIQLWLNADSVNALRYLLILNLGAAFNAFVFGWAGNNAIINAVKRTSGGWSAPISTTALSASTWYKVTLTYNTVSGWAMYWNTSSTTNATLSSIDVVSSENALGGIWDGSYTFLGKVDEVRFSSSTRTSNWIATEYNNQNAPSTFMAFGSEVGQSNVFLKTISSSIAISESAINDWGIGRTKSLSEGPITLSESLDYERGISLPLSETPMDILESLLSDLGLGLSLPLSESPISISESLDKQIDYNRNISNIFNISELFGRQIDFIRNYSEIKMDISELLLKQVSYKRSLSESSLALSEILSKGFGKGLLESPLTLLESLVSQKTFFRNISEIQFSIVETLHNMPVHYWQYAIQITYSGGAITLHKPYYRGLDGSISFNVSNFSFRSGNYDSYIDDLNDERITLIGYEYDDAMTKFVQLSTVADAGFEITISNLGSEWDGIYIIERMSYSPIGLDVFDYNIQLKFVRPSPGGGASNIELTLSDNAIISESLDGELT